MQPSSHPEPRSCRYAFNKFILDVESGFLRHDGNEIALQPKAFEVLSYLVERHGRLVTKTELMDAVWPETAITDNSLSQCLVQIRRALADDSQQMIRTVARRGYVFAAHVTTPPLEMPRSGDHLRTEAATPVLVPVPPPGGPGSGLYRKSAMALAAVAAAGLLFWAYPRRNKPELRYTQITNFPDFASGPALSRDGRMVAFFRGSNSFATPTPVYVKMLPNGDPVKVTDDGHNKYGLAFSHDGSHVAYTRWNDGTTYQWNTYTVPLPGGTPSLLFANAAGLTWLDERRLLYSEIRSGLHMGLVTSSLNRTDRREIYFPEHERRMAHYSYPSPDGKWLLTVEMEPTWLPCRILPFDGSSSGKQVGPTGPCTAAGWSPDGKWMYFGVHVNGANHLWRQAFPDGQPEQLTFGPAEEEGLAVAPDGSLITSVGVRQGAVWIHDSKGERAISPEGFAAANYLVLTAPKFSTNGRELYYLLRRDTPGSITELWRTNLDTNASEAIVRDFGIIEFDIEGDEGGGGEVVFSAEPPGKPSQIWLARLDRGSPPKRIADTGEGAPRFGPDGTLWFRYTDGKTNYVGMMKKDGTQRRKMAPYAISTLMNSSPGGRWVTAMAPAEGKAVIDTIAISVDGGARRTLCPGRCSVAWDRDGKFFYVGVASNTSLAFPVARGDLPEQPAGGFASLDKSPPAGVRLVPGAEISPGSDPSIFAFVKNTTHRNLFRISLD